MKEKETMDVNTDVEASGQCLVTKQKTWTDTDFSQNSRATTGFFHHFAQFVLFSPFVLNIRLFAVNYENNVCLFRKKIRIVQSKR